MKKLKALHQSACVLTAVGIATTVASSVWAQSIQVGRRGDKTTDNNPNNNVTPLTPTCNTPISYEAYEGLTWATATATYVTGQLRNCSGQRAIRTYAYGNLSSKASAEGASSYYGYTIAFNTSGVQVDAQIDSAADGVWQPSATGWKNIGSTAYDLHVFAFIVF